MTEQPKRRWYRFSLRTLFILLTLLCIYLGYQLNIVRERKAALAELAADGTANVMTAAAWGDLFGPAGPSDPVKTIPWPRTWLGDEAIQTIHYWPGRVSEERLTELREVFPEANLEEVPLEPCHPGCFPRGTLVMTLDGERLIEEIQPGEFVISIDAQGSRRELAVTKVFETKNRLWRIVTEAGELITTETQPLCVAMDQIRQAGKLQPGDTVMVEADGNVQPVAVLRVESTERIDAVFNLILSDREIFVANGYLARSKPPAVLETATESPGRPPVARATSAE